MDSLDEMAAGSSEEDQRKFKSGTEDSEDESEILEESPCGRWLKRREVVHFPIVLKFFTYLFILIIQKYYSNNIFE